MHLPLMNNIKQNGLLCCNVLRAKVETQNNILLALEKVRVYIK